MTNKRLLIHTAFMLLLPIIVAWFGLSVLSAIGLVLLMLAWRWLISVSAFVMPEKVPQYTLDTIPASHFAEKVRWNLDRAGIEYEENASAGVLGAVFLGRTVPRLRVKTGAVRSEIGNSPEILRYVWGACPGNPKIHIAHLKPTPERLALEKRLDRHGVNLQVWVYGHLLEERDLTLHLWGANSPEIAAWQRASLRLFFPLLAFFIRRTFRITPAHCEKAGEHIDALLKEMEATLADGRASILGGEINFTDLAFAAMTGLWLQPDWYGGGKANDVLLERDQLPDAMHAEINTWCAENPRVVAWVERLYNEER